MKRRILGVVAGLVVGFVVLFPLEMAGHAIWPLPADPHDPNVPKDLLMAMPVAALAWIVAGFAVATFTGGLVAAAIAKARGPALVVGAIFLLATIATFVVLQHPVWMIVAGLLVPLPSAWLGGRLVTRHLKEEAPTTART